MNPCCRRFGLGLVLLVLGPSLASAQDKTAAGKARYEKARPNKAAVKQAKASDPLEFWFDPRRAQPAAAAELILAQNPYTILELRYWSRKKLVWAEPEFASEEAPPLDPEWLGDVRQRDRQPMPNLVGRAPDEIPKAYRSFINLYNEALVHAFWTPADVFAKSAKENEHVTFAHMYTQTDKYRGKVIHLEGQLRRVRKYDNVPQGARDKGVLELYEGWIQLPTLKSHPVCVVFPILPDGLKPAEHMNRWVAFDGYLIYLYRYRSGKDQDLNTPLLIGPTVRMEAEAPAAERPLLSPTLIYVFVGFVAAVVMVVVGLSWWFRRGDQRVRDHLARMRAQRTVEMLDDDRAGEGNGYRVDRENETN
jgi:hypothetical protein